jgi:hypothetical protein
MAVLVDSSLWVHQLRKSGAPAHRDRVNALLENGEAAWCPAIRLELCRCRCRCRRRRPADPACHFGFSSAVDVTAHQQLGTNRLLPVTPGGCEFVPEALESDPYISIAVVAISGHFH